MKKILFVFGTRPEAIKVIPVIRRLRAGDAPKRFEVRVCVTAQHRQMLDQVMGKLEVKADYDLDIMQEEQSLYDITVTYCLSSNFL